MTPTKTEMIANADGMSVTIIWRNEKIDFNKSECTETPKKTIN